LILFLQEVGPMALQVLVIDDDEVSREVFTLLLHGAGYLVQTADSGDGALLYLQTADTMPQVVLTDMQMPGTSGSELARQLRRLCGPATTLLAMSASTPDDFGREYDGFLLKPFTMQTLASAIAGATPEAKNGPNGVKGAVLDESVYRKLSRSMRGPQLEQLYALCLADAEKRLVGMRRAAAEGDDAAYRREAHAIKGGCGMVGAFELQMLATSMEMGGLSDDHVASLDEFVVACQRLRRMLIGHEITSKSGQGVSGEDAR